MLRLGTDIKPILALLLGMFLCQLDVMASTGAAPMTSQQHQKNKIALLPLENLTGKFDAVNMLMPKLDAALQERGFTLYPPQELRKLIRKHRVRSVGRIDFNAVEMLYREAGVDWVALGALDIYDEGNVPEVGLSLRFLDAASAKMVWAGNAAESGQDRAWAFGLGQISDMQTLSDHAVAALVKSLPTGLTGAAPETSTRTVKVAIIPFDNFSEEAHAANILSNLVLANLYTLKLEILEPGIVEEFLTERNFLARGEVDQETTRELLRKFGIDFIVTGSVDTFNPGQGDAKTHNPQVEFSLKYMQAGSRMLAGISINTASGKQSESLFGLGKQYSILNLVSRQITNTLTAANFNQLITLREGLQ